MCVWECLKAGVGQLAPRGLALERVLVAVGGSFRAHVPLRIGDTSAFAYA
jgi:hypothetical protein